MPELTRHGEVFILDLGSAENSFNPGFVEAVEEALDEVEAAPVPRALVTTASGKSWSHGLDLEWLAANPEEVAPFLERVHGLLARTLALGVPSVAALQGHAFAAGAMLSLAHDTRIMRADRGYWCLPEIDIRIPFTPGMCALIQARLSPAVAHESMTTGRRYGGMDAAAAGIVDEAAGEDRVLPRAVERAAALAGKDGATLGAIKRAIYAGPLATLLDTDANRPPVPIG